MRIVTNPGSNLCPEALARYDVFLTPQTILVDGEAYDTRGEIPLPTIDSWVESAEVHPYVVGTTAAEFAGVYRKLARRDREIFSVQTSRKIIGSYDAALSAARTLATAPGYSDVHVVVADSGMTDVGAGLATILAGEAVRAGLSLAQVAEVVEAFRTNARLLVLPRVLDYLVKGGRATPLRAWIANMLRVRPMISFVEGEVTAVAKVSAKADPATAVVEEAVREFGEGRAVWAAAVHGNDEETGVAMERALLERFDVQFCLSKALSASIYLHCGPGAVGAVVFPLDALPYPLAAPEPFR